MLWLTDRRGRKVGVPADKVAYVDIGADAGERRVGFAASGDAARERLAPRSPAGVRHRQGRGGQEHHRRRRWRCSARSRASARSSARSTPRATWPTSTRRRAPSFKPREVQPGLFAMSMDTEASLQEYLRLQLRLPRDRPHRAAGRAPSTSSPPPLPASRRSSPSASSCWEVRERHYDLVVVDASPTGHIVGQLAAPQAINELVKVGPRAPADRLAHGHPGRPRHHRAGDRHDARGDAGQRDHRAGRPRARRRPNVDLAAIVVNRVLPELFSRSEEEVFERPA